MKQLAYLLAMLILGVFAGTNYGYHRAEMLYRAPLEKYQRVVVAQRNLYPGDIIGGDSAAIRNIPEQYLPSYAVPAADSESYLTGKKVIRDLKRGDLILLEHVE